jgi:general secretion pathway protein J
MSSWKKIGGFTLIEILVALLILAVIATLGITGLQSIVLSDKRQIEVTDQLAQLQFAYILMQRDISQIINRPIIDGNEETRPGFLGVEKLEAQIVSDIPLEGEIIMEFTRGGIPDFQESGARSTLARIAYVYNGKNLYRYEWPLLDRFASTPFSYRKILDNIQLSRVSYIGADNVPNPQWATETDTEVEWLKRYPFFPQLPKAIEIYFEDPRYSVIHWIFAVNKDRNDTTEKNTNR